MKSISVFALVILTCSPTAFAQLRKGSAMISGGISYNRNNGQGFFVASVEQMLVDRFNGYASVGSLFTDRFAMGLDLNVDYYFYEIESSGFTGNSRLVETITTTTPGLFTRYYFPLSQKFAVFLEGGFGFGFGTTKSAVYGDPTGNPPSSQHETKSKTTALRLKFGINYFVTDRFALEVSPAQIKWSNVKSESADPQAGFAYFNRTSEPELWNRLLPRGRHFNKQLAG